MSQQNFINIKNSIVEQLKAYNDIKISQNEKVRDHTVDIYVPEKMIAIDFIYNSIYLVNYVARHKSFEKIGVEYYYFDLEDDLSSQDELVVKINTIINKKKTECIIL